MLRHHEISSNVDVVSLMPLQFQLAFCTDKYACFVKSSTSVSIL
jgi:hypothetical protein